MAAELYTALEVLRPKDISSVPLDSDLNIFLRDIFAQAELIANSVPAATHLSPISASSPSSSSSSSSSASPLAVRGPPHGEALRKHWGKPLKVSAKDNPLDVAVYKMAGHDRHGAWFARRSVHRGLPFATWAKAMRREFAVSLAVRDRGPGAGSVRGIGADERLESRVVDGVGKAEVYLLSAKFGGPVAPREFVTLLLTSSEALGERSAVDAGKGRGKRVPRHYLVVSIPVDHPEAPGRDGMVRGYYESVELIREVTLATEKDSDGQDSEAGPEETAVEWTMITRSDPGGGIPKFMVERNTPASVTADAAKFLSWAKEQGDAPDADEALLQQAQEGENPAAVIAANDGAESKVEEEQPKETANGSVESPIGAEQSLTSAYEPAAPSEGGLLSSLTTAVGNGIQNYAPAVVADNIPSSLLPDSTSRHRTASDSDSDDSTETSSLSSFASARQFTTAEDGSSPAAAAGGPGSPGGSSPTLSSSAARASQSSLGLALDRAPSPGTSSLQSQQHPPAASQHDKELAKLTAKRHALEAKFEKAQAARLEQLQTAPADAERKARARHEKERRKAEDRHRRELRKLDEKAHKAAERRRRAEQKDELETLRREKRELAKRVEELGRENERLDKALGELQREITGLVREVGRLDGGREVLERIRGKGKEGA